MLPFKIQIPEGERRPEFADELFWRRSGELPGVLNWALQGLRRLHQRGRFVEPEASISAKSAYRLDANPAAQFLEETVDFCPGSEVATTGLYTEYKTWAVTNGYRPLAANTFATEVKRIWPDVQITKNPRSVEGVRTRCWINLKRKGVLRAVVMPEESRELELGFPLE